jgi:hypothetical protein
MRSKATAPLCLVWQESANERKHHIPELREDKFCDRAAARQRVLTTCNKGYTMSVIHERDAIPDRRTHFFNQKLAEMPIFLQVLKKKDRKAKKDLTSKVKFRLLHPSLSSILIATSERR